MELIHTGKICFNYPSSPEILLEDITVRVHNKSSIGLIGNNGCGKSTLIKILSGELEPVSGSIYRQDSLRIGILSQEVSLDDNCALSDFIWRCRPDFAEIHRGMQNAPESSPEYGNLVGEYYQLGIDRFQIEMDKMLEGFSLGGDKLSVAMSSLSGGEKTKAMLARMLLCGADLMLLDEPTNHLELKSLQWLEEYLRKCAIPFVAISHDRRFLDNCATEIWELKDRHIDIYSGNYTFYRTSLETERARQKREYDSQQKKIRQLKQAANLSRQASASHQAQTGTEGFAPIYESVGNEARKAMKSALRVEKRIRMMIEKEEAKKPFIEKERRISIHSAPLNNPVVLRIKNLSKSFGDKNIFKNINLDLQGGTKLGVLGANGCGKSTLLNIICGIISQDSGSFQWAPKAKVGYYAQGHENLDMSSSILDEVLQGRSEEQTMARIILGRLNIRRDQVYQKIETLSVGERSKVALAKILFSDFNILVFDEPTNHIEISAREAFEEALESFDGTVVLVSHDRYLLSRIVNEVFDLERNRYYRGSYSEYVSG